MLKSPLVPIFLIVSVDVLGLTIILPLLPFYAEKLGASPAVVGLLVSTYALCQLIAGPMLGRISDRTGRKPLLLVSQLGTFIGFIILAYAHALWVVFLSRIIDGLTAGNLSLAQAYISDVTRPEERTKSFALIGIAFGMGFTIGPGITGYLSQFGYQYPVFAAAGLSALSILSTYTMLPSKTPHAEGDAPPKFKVFDFASYVQYFHRPGLGALLWQFLLFILAFSMFMSGLPLFAERRFSWNGHPFGTREVGYMYAYLGMLGVVLQGGLIRPLAKKFGDLYLVRGGFLFAIIGMAALAYTYGIPVLLVVSAIASSGLGVIRPALTSLITHHASRTEQGVVLGLTQSLASIAAIVAPAIGGFLIGQAQLVAWALLISAISSVSLLIRQRSDAGQLNPG